MVIRITYMNIWMFKCIWKQFIRTETEAYECSCKWRGEAKARMCKYSIRYMLHLAGHILWRHHEGAPDCLYTNECAPGLSIHLGATFVLQRYTTIVFELSLFAHLEHQSSRHMFHSSSMFTAFILAFYRVTKKCFRQKFWNFIKKLFSIEEFL